MGSTATGSNAQGSSYVPSQGELFGHPAGLFTLFFAEMWERFSYYGMRSLLIFYMVKGFLGYNDKQAYVVYGAYTALVYMTPFFGGMLADRLLGARVAVVIGGLLMAAGHLLMMWETPMAFYAALGLLIVGNGFFKPNISTTVGTLYPPGSPKRDAGFTIFYIGINLGAAMSPLVCGYVGETYGWHYGFGLATIGMLVGLAVFVMPTIVTQLLILSTAAASVVSLFVFRNEGSFSLGLNAFIGIALAVAALMAVVALTRGGLPKAAGVLPSGPPKLAHVGLVLLGIAILLPVFVLLVSGFSVVRASGEQVQLISEETIESVKKSGLLGKMAATPLEEMSRPAGLVLAIAGLISFGYLARESFRLPKVPRHRMWAALVMIFFSILFWAFFEQAGSSLNNFTDRNIDRVGQTKVVTKEMVGQTIKVQPTQEQLGYTLDGEMFTLDNLTKLRDENVDKPNFEIDWKVSDTNVGMGLALREEETPASVFQAVNPTCILLFGMVFSSLWVFLATRGLEPNTPIKFSLGLLQLGLGFGAFWLGANAADDRGMVSATWLILGYALHTTGELCLSPVGLSMICKLSPARLVSTMMGGWFLATAFSQYLAGIISAFTAVEGGSGEDKGTPPPLETVVVYGNVFQQIAISAIISALICFAISPLLKYWMHEEEAA